MHGSPGRPALELWLVVAGRRELHVAGSVLRLREAMLCWLFPEVQHQTLYSSDDLLGWRVVAATDVTDITDQAVGGPVLVSPGTATQPFVMRLHSSDVRWIYERLDELAHLPDNPAEFRVGLAHVLLRAWRLRSTAANAQPPASALVRQAVEMLKDPAAQVSWSATALARALDISAGQLQRRFRAETGQTVTQYRLTVQLARYLDLCDDDHDLSITEAAHAAGFGSYAQFHRIFVRHMNTSPSRHRGRRRAGTG